MVLLEVVLNPMDSQIDLLIVVPCFNEANSILSMISRLAQVFNDDDRTMLLFIDDGSTDGTGDQIKNTIRPLPNAAFIGLSSNTSKEGAMLAGLDFACHLGSACLMLDADGQHPIGVAEEMVKHFRATGGGSAGRRVEPQRRRGTRLLTKFMYRAISGKQVVDANGLGDFRLLTPNEVRNLVAHREKIRFSKLLYLDVVRNPREFQYESITAIDGRGSRWSLSQLIDYAVDGLINSRRRFSRGLITFALFVFGLSCIYGMAVVIDVLWGGSSGTGIASILVLIMGFGSFQLLAIAVIGEYVVRILIESKQRPGYLVDELVNTGTWLP